MSNYVEVRFLKRVDADILKSTDFDIRVVNEYDSGLSSSEIVSVSSLSGAEKSALTTVFDALVYGFESAAYVFSVVRSGVSFDFSASYYRDAVSTIDKTDFPDGKTVMVRFEFAGFDTNDTCDVVFEYGSGISSTDETLLAGKGVYFLENGIHGFEIQVIRECKVKFYKPGAETGVYVFDDPLNDNVYKVL